MLDTTMKSDAAVSPVARVATISTIATIRSPVSHQDLHSIAMKYLSTTTRIKGYLADLSARGQTDNKNIKSEQLNERPRFHP